MSETFNREQVDMILAPWLNLCKEQEETIAKQRELIQKMVDAWDNNDRAAYQGIIEEMEALWKG